MLPYFLLWAFCGNTEHRISAELSIHSRKLAKIMVLYAVDVIIIWKMDKIWYLRKAKKHSISRQYFNLFQYFVISAAVIAEYWKMLNWCEQNIRNGLIITTQKTKFPIKDFLRKFDQICATKSASCGFSHIYWRNP